MERVGGNVKTISGRERLRFAFRSDCHFPLQDDVRRHSGVGMIRIEGVRPVLPYVGCAKAFTVQFVFPISYIHKSVTFQLVAMPVKLSKSTDECKYLRGGS